MARTTQTGVELPAKIQPEVWIQYKGNRARILQTAKDAERRTEAPVILDEFQADLQALSLSVPGVPMDDIRIVWGTGQVRAKYNFPKNGFCDTIKYLVKRASTSMSDTLTERSIARLFYAESGTPLATEKLLVTPPRPKSSYRSIPQPRASSSNMASSAGSSQPKQPSPLKSDGPHSPIGASNNVTSMLPTRDRQTLAPDYLHVSSPRPQLLVPPLRTTVSSSSAGNGHTILPPIFLSPATLLNEHRLPPRGVTATTIQTHSDSPEEIVHASQASAASRASDELGVPRGMAGLQPTHISRAVSLTPGACMRLRDCADNAILSVNPVVRFLVLRRVNPDLVGNNKKLYEAFITDGHGYTWIAIASDILESVGSSETGLQAQVGSAVRLKRMTRLPRSDLCDVLVQNFELVENSDTRSVNDDEIGCSRTPPKSNAPSATILSLSGPFAAPSAQSERAGRLLAEMKLKEERRRRLLLERVLADVCLDLEHTNAVLTPAVLEVLQKIDGLANAALLIE